MATKNKPKTTKSKPKNSTKKPTTSTTKKKPSTKKSTPKKKQPTKRKSTKKRASKKGASNEKFFKLVSIILGMIMLVSLGYFWGHNDVAKSEIKHKAQRVKLKAKGAKSLELRAKSEIKPKAKSKKKPKTTQTSKLNPQTSNLKPQTSKLKPQNSKLNPQTSPLTPHPSEHLTLNAERYLHPSTLPKLVIIIDDVHTKKTLKALKAMPYKITPSIFPPYQRAWHTPSLAKNLKHYMVHLPMESSSAKFNRQTKTILTSWSQSQIDSRIKAIREMFPTAKYINNHTGSVLTANYHSMDMVYKALIDNGFVFVDSYTTPKSKVAKIAKKYNIKYLKRDVFIDNIQNIAYIKKQIKKGIKIAKKRGYAIIIGHPHKATLQALKSSSKLLDSVEVVYMDELIK